MIETTLPPEPERWARLPAPVHALLEQVAMLQLENAALRAQNAALQERNRQLEARLGQNSLNSSRPPSTDPLQAPPRPQVPPTGLSGRYRLSRREVRQLLQDLWAVRLSLGAVVRQEQAQCAALAPIVEEAQAAVQQAAVVNMDETGWREDKQRAWLWTVVTAETVTA